ncbi:MAG: thioesterase family protein [Oleibacter sp.]|nr:thioesterase family protein [Thalassolituus sp.]
MKPFDHYYQQMKTPGSVSLDGSWAQGRTTFGGMSAGLALATIEAQHPTDHPLRSLSVHFCGPLFTEVPFEGQTRVLSAGKSVANYQCDLMQNDACVTSVIACYGKNRESDIDVPEADIPPETINEGKLITYIKGLTPDFAQHIDYRYVDGGMPFSGSEKNCLKGWMRFNDSTSLITDAHLIALIDAWPPATLQKLKSPAPCATVSWSLEFVDSPSRMSPPLTCEDWLYYECLIIEASGGYAHTTAKIYSATGDLLALSRQLVVVYDKSSKSAKN